MAMMMVNTDSPVQMCNSEDYCYLCAREIRGEDRTDVHEKVKALKGKLTSQKAVKFVKSGNPICICKNCIDKMHEELHAGDIDETKQD